MAVSIFISCVSREFRAYREELRHALTSRNFEVKVQEDFETYGKTLLVELAGYIVRSTAVIHLVGNARGFVPEPEVREQLFAAYPGLKDKMLAWGIGEDGLAGMSATQWEAWLAHYFGKRLFIAAAADGAQREPDFVEAKAEQDWQIWHRNYLQQVGRYCDPKLVFANPGELAAKAKSGGLFEVLAEALAEEKASMRAVPSQPVSPSTAFQQSMWANAAGSLIATLAFSGLSAVWIALINAVVKKTGSEFGLLYTALGIAVILIASIYVWLVLKGASAADMSPDREKYLSFRRELAEGGAFSIWYNRWLTRALDAVDRFYGDAGHKDQRYVPAIFRLKNPAPLWTAVAYDRSLLLALAYPVMTIFIFWTMSGHSGPAEQALGLRAELPDWRRWAAVVAIAISIYGLYKFSTARGWLEMLWITVAGAGAVAVAGASAFAFAFAFAFAVTVAVAGAFAVAVAGAGAGAGAGAVAVAVAGAVAILFLNEWSLQKQCQGRFLSLYTIFMFGVCGIVIFFFTTNGTWTQKEGSLLLFLGLLTLVNAPFDWLSLGLTRALLRRGLEKQGLAPIFYAIVDAMSAALIVVLLAMVAAVAIQAFDTLAIVRGGKAILPLVPLLDGLARNPGAPEYWWIYAMLLSTLIPSIVNLFIASLAALRGVPLVTRWIVGKLPEQGGIAAADRILVTMVLTLQFVGGAIAAVVIQYAVIYFFFGLLLPLAGFSLLDDVRAVVEFDLPGRLMR